MTEAEWLACTDPEPMLEFLEKSSRASERKLRWFGCACIRHIWDWLTDVRSQNAVAVAEWFADEDLGRMRLLKIQKVRTAWDAAGADWRVFLQDPHRFAADYSAWAASRLEGQEPRTAERSFQAGLIRCVVGNPFHPVTIDPAWRTPRVVALAQAIYEERSLPSGRLDNARLHVLADALQEAGCTSTELLALCRSGGEHSRGCWVIDLLLSKG